MRPLSFLFLIVVFLVLTSRVEAAQVLKTSSLYLITTVDAGDDSEIRQEVCLVRNQRTYLCGEIAKKVGNKVALRIRRFNRLFPVQSGDRFSMHSVSRSLAQVNQSMDQYRRETGADRKTSLSLGTNAGLSFIYPILHLETVLEHGYTIGLMPLYLYQMGSGYQARGIGGFATMGYYFDEIPYQSFGLLGGFGMYSLYLDYSDNEENAMLWSSFLQLQYRVSLFNSRWSLGLTAGVQYVLSSTTLVTVNITGITPIASGFLSATF